MLNLLNLLGIVYFFVFFPFLFQMLGLFGSNGILPIKDYLQFYKKYRYYFPTLFWIDASDRSLMLLPICGTILSLFLACGFFFALPLLIILHLSLISAGQDFLSFGWELFFLEISYNAVLIFLTNEINPIAWLSMNLLIFRFHLQSGASKLQSHDPNWRNLTALKYHYETQPLPNPLAWYIHKLPLSFHKFSTLMVFILEIIVPFGVLGPPPVRLITFILLATLQLSIAISGNYSYLNLLTLVLITLLIKTPLLMPFPTTQVALHIPIALISLFLIALQLARLYSHFIPNPICEKILNPFTPFHVANRYGIFSIMTTKRYEVVIEGSMDKEEWKEYYFYHKPQELTKRPTIIAPYQPRLDWQAWFLPFGYLEDASWFQRFLYCLLEGNAPVLRLIKHNPFSKKPPQYIRASMYLYTFSDWETKKKTGQWWTRKYAGQFTPTYKKLS